ncbi:hypothetical protein CLV56_2050 [Mumia flava]|uniref:Integral membrane protein n=1 Tax=Mumia flava TaxID=1348852 RepID=A0A2M9BIR5_9ACTN|nr:hypothetical protein [Mumia flava]PJJ57812.1 hypothetical protein CLV56_2050 [Mumia flava]
MAASNESGGAEDEIAALRAEVARLRAEASAREAGESPPADDGATTGRTSSRWRWVAFGVLVALAVVLALGGVVSRYTASILLDTDRYVETVAPLADEPAVQDQIVDTATEQLMAQVDVEAMIRQALTGLTEVAPRVPDRVVGLTPVLTSQVETFVHNTLERLVRSDAFATTWAEANRQAHDSVVAVLTGREDSSVTVDDRGTVSVRLDALLAAAKEQLVNRGFTFVEGLPSVNAEFEVFQSADVVRAQRATDLLDRTSTVLPWLALLLTALAIWAAPLGRRRRALVVAALAIALSMLLLALAVAIGRSFYLSAVPADLITIPAAETVFDAVVDPLRTTFRAVFALGVVVALVAFLSGPSPAAVGLRRGVGSVRQRWDDSDREPSGAELWLGRNRILVRSAIIAVAAVVLVFWRYPSGLVVITIALLAALALVVTEVLGRTPRPHDESAEVPS